MYIVGQTYTLPTVTVAEGKYTFVVLHDHIGDISKERHLHIDLRFVSDETLRQIGRDVDEILATNPFPIVMREMVCCRDYVPVKKFSNTSRGPFLTIQKKHQDCVMRNNICPHQGCDLSSIGSTKIQGQEALVCPCHGLTWSVETGKMIHRMPRKQPEVI